MRGRHVLGLAVVAAAIGCSGAPSRIKPPHVDAESAAAAAIEQYDRDGDARLNRDELSACPPLASALAAYDTDKDAALAEAEIAAGIARWSEGTTGAMSLPFRIQLDGRPLGGAEIKLIPAAFLGNGVKPAGGVAGPGGAGYLGMSEADRPANAPGLPLVQPGLFTVEVTHPTVKVPAKFNVSTTLGIETSVAGQNPAGVDWSLSSK